MKLNNKCPFPVDGNCSYCPYVDFVEHYDKFGRATSDFDVICVYVENSSEKTCVDLEKQGKE